MMARHSNYIYFWRHRKLSIISRSFIICNLPRTLAASDLARSVLRLTFIIAASTKLQISSECDAATA
ncbi:hypothetical protein ACHAXM_007439 [Skeletonema potamos]